MQEGQCCSEHGGAVELLLVRHGLTDWNSSGRFQGRSDIPLSPDGEAQAHAVAEALADLPLDAAYSSDLARAASTARAILAGRTIPFTLDARLREFDFGAWEGKTWAEITAAFPGDSGTQVTSAREYQPRDGENFADVRRRVRAWLQELAPYDRRRVLVVAHAGTLHALFAELLGLKFDTLALRFSHASISRVSSSEDGWQVLSLDETAHLQSPRAHPITSPSLRADARPAD